jgi:hypothetical protein
VTKGHGRIETRAMWTSTDLVGYTTFPHAAQVFRLERTVAITLLRLAGCRNIAAGLRRCARQVARPLRLIGVTV